MEPTNLPPDVNTVITKNKIANTELVLFYICIKVYLYIGELIEIWSFYHLCLNLRLKMCKRNSCKMTVCFCVVKGRMNQPFGKDFEYFHVLSTDFNL